MSRTSDGRAPLAAALVFVLVAAALVVATSLWSCNGKKKMDTRVPTEGVPVIRVLLTSRPEASVTVSTPSGYRLIVDGREVDASAEALPRTQLTRLGDRWRIDRLGAEGKEIQVVPLGGVVYFEATGYRGPLRLIAREQGDFIIVNDVDVESYLAGVLTKELPARWSPATYRALAIAARTFALYHRATFGPSNDYDVGDTQAWQVYGGFTAETEKSWSAVEGTRGMVLTYGQAGDERIFMAQYSAACGGYVNGAEVIRSAPAVGPFQGGQVCNYCRGAPRYRWAPVTVPKDSVYQAMVRAYRAAEKLDGVREIKVVSSTPYGRAVWVDVIAPNGQSLRVRAEDVRLALLRAGTAEARKLYSMNCRIRDRGASLEFYDGRGFGHGVGLCQWGAQGMAIEGFSGEEIIDFYYPGATIVRTY